MKDRLNQRQSKASTHYGQRHLREQSQKYAKEIQIKIKGRALGCRGSESEFKSSLLYKQAPGQPVLQRSPVSKNLKNKNNKGSKKL